MKIRKSIVTAAVSGLCGIGLLVSAVPANAYSSTNFYNSPGSCWGGVVWGGSSWYSGSTSLASTSEQNNPYLSYQVSAAVRWNPTNTVVSGRKYGYNYAADSYGASDPTYWRYGGSHSFGGAWGNS